MKSKILSRLLTLVCAFCLLSGVAVAAENTNTNVSIPSGQTVPTDLINAGQNVDVGGNVQGDAILAGANVSFSGNTTGDILLAGGNVRVKGDSAGNVRVVGGNITLDGVVNKNVTIVGGSVIIDEDSVVKGNLYVAGGSVELRGQVQGNAAVYGSQVIFSGKVQGNADFEASEVIIRQDAAIAGNLTYASSTDLAISEGVVRGTVTKVPMKNYASNYAQTKQAESTSNLGVIVWQFLSLLVVMLVLSRFFAKQIKALTLPIAREEVWARIASGFIWLVLNPIIIFITFLTVIGLPLALMLLFVYVVLLIIALAITPALLGRLANTKLKLYAETADGQTLWKDFILGYVLMQLIGLVPVLGALFLLLLFLFSFGRVSKFVSTTLRENR